MSFRDKLGFAQYNHNLILPHLARRARLIVEIISIFSVTVSDLHLYERVLGYPIP